MEMAMAMEMKMAMEMENCNYIFSTLQIAVFYKLNFISRQLAGLLLCESSIGIRV